MLVLGIYDYRIKVDIKKQNLARVYGSYVQGLSSKVKELRECDSTWIHVSIDAVKS